MMLRIDIREESKFNSKRSILMEIPGLSLASETCYLNSRIESHSGANSNSGFNSNSDSVSRANCDSQVYSNSGTDSGFRVDSGISSGDNPELVPESAPESAPKVAAESKSNPELILNTE